MNAQDLDRLLADWFESDASTSVPAEGVDRALSGARRRQPRPAWLAGLGSHWGWSEAHAGSGVALRVGPRSPARWSVALLLVTLLAIVLGGTIVGAQLLRSPSPQAPRLGRLAYAVDGDIFLADWDGRNATRIADGLPGAKLGCGPAGYWSEGPMWAPDGQLFAFRSPRSQVDCKRPEADTYPTVLLSDPAGRVVASFPGVGWLLPWSPDSTRVATWLDLYPATRIGVYDISGVRQALLSLPPHLYGTTNGDYDPVWSPDGASLLLTAPGGTWEVPIDGSPPRLLPDGDVRSVRHFSALSPDGRQDAGIGAEHKLLVGPVDGSEWRELAIDATWTTPAWSPTGDRIAFTAGLENDLGVAIWSELRVIDLASGTVTTLVRTDDGDRLSVSEFSPEGDRILFGRQDRDGEERSTWSVNADGSDPRLLVAGSENADWQSVPSDTGQ